MAFLRSVWWPSGLRKISKMIRGMGRFPWDRYEEDGLIEGLVHIRDKWVERAGEEAGRSFLTSVLPMSRLRRFAFDLIWQIGITMWFRTFVFVSPWFILLSLNAYNYKTRGIRREVGYVSLLIVALSTSPLFTKEYLTEIVQYRLCFKSLLVYSVCEWPHISLRLEIESHPTGFLHSFCRRSCFHPKMVLAA